MSPCWGRLWGLKMTPQTPLPIVKGSGNTALGTARLLLEPHQLPEVGLCWWPGQLASSARHCYCVESSRFLQEAGWCGNGTLKLEGFHNVDIKVNTDGIHLFRFWHPRPSSCQYRLTSESLGEAIEYRRMAMAITGTLNFSLAIHCTHHLGWA